MKAGTQNHLKVKRLMRLLNAPMYRAVGILETLWLLCQDCCDEGNIGKYTDDEIADYLGWDGPQTASELVRALSDSGWTDPDDEERLVVHDWLEHAPEYIRERVRKRIARGGKARKQKTYAQSKPDKVGQTPDQPPFVPSIPNQSQPNPTQPGQTNTSCVETEIPSSTPDHEDEPSVLAFPCDGTPSAWGLVESQLAQWRDLYPSLDVDTECRSALAWVLADSTRRKTARGMPRFLVGWLSRSQNRGNGRKQGGNNAGRRKFEFR
jgi:hypothetical protein